METPLRRDSSGPADGSELDLAVDGLRVDFCGERYDVPAGQGFVIGREADLSVDDNPYLHRRFLDLRRRDGFWWITNLGSRLSATLFDSGGLMQAWLAPEATLPLVFARTTVLFTAGPTTYDVEVLLRDEPFRAAPVATTEDGVTTLAPRSLTAQQRLLVLALAEPLLRRTGRGTSAIPSTAAAAARLGWTQTKFNRQLDAVCDKLSRAGERGLHGGPGQLASTRRARLVELAIATQLVTAADLPLLVAPSV